MTPDLVADYAARGGEYRRTAADAARVERRIALGRLVVFGVGALITIAVAEVEVDVGWGLAALGVVAAGFYSLVAWHAGVRERVRTFRALAAACDVGAARALRQWDNLPPAAVLAHEVTHAFADDLHVDGTHSIARLLPPVSRVAGRGVVREWLLAESPPDAPTLRERQSAVRELVSRAEWRERVTVLASRLVANETTVDEFVRWSESDATRPSGTLRWTARLLAVVAVGTFVAALAGVVPAAAPLVAVAVNLVVTVVTRRATTSAMNVVAGHDARLRGLGDLLAQAGDGLRDEVESPLLARLHAALGGGAAVGAFRWFDQLARFAEVRLSPMGHFVMQALVLWDIHVVDALERWRARHGRSVRAWLRALGEIEALAALATLAYDNPSWSFAELDDGAAATLEATGLAHPLLAAGVAVPNDVRIGGPGEILFITGSNMSGKSTLLRGIGLNLVLAQAGAPVCASSMRLARARLCTSIDATDALERGLSLFMSELLRIKAIVDAARAPADCRLLYIADEMLRGTNARDRHAAIVTILGQLVRAGAVGVVATHDPDLARDPRLESHLHPHHFLEHFEGDGRAASMSFDYTLRRGLATTRNAIKLLELVGLGDGADRDEEL